MRTVKKPCSALGCDRTSSSRGWCTMHYARWRRTGDANTPGAAERITPVDGENPAIPCTVEGCPRGVRSLGLCSLHYHRMRSHGTTEVRSRLRDYRCTIEGCQDRR